MTNISSTAANSVRKSPFAASTAPRAEAASAVAIIVRVDGLLGSLVFQTEFGAVLARRACDKRLSGGRNPARFFAVQHSLQRGAMNFQGPREGGDG